MTEIVDNTNEYELAPLVDRLGQFTELFGEKAAEPLQEYHDRLMQAASDQTSMEHVFNEFVVREAGQRLATGISSGKAESFYDETGKLTAAGELAAAYTNEVARHDLSDGDTKDAESDPAFSILLESLNAGRVADTELAEVGARAEDYYRKEQKAFEQVTKLTEGVPEHGYDVENEDGTVQHVSPRQELVGGGANQEVLSLDNIASVPESKTPDTSVQANEAAYYAHRKEMAKQDAGIQGVARRISHRLGRTPKDYDRTPDDVRASQISRVADELAHKSGEKAVQAGEAAIANERRRREEEQNTNE
jgi:hypothetical protein